MLELSRIFHISTQLDSFRRDLPWVPTVFYDVTLTLGFGLLFENFSVAGPNIFWTRSARVLIFRMDIFSDKTNISYPVTFDLGFWPAFRKLNYNLFLLT